MLQASLFIICLKYIVDVVIVGTQAGHAEVVSENVRNDYSYIFANNPIRNALIARCVTGLGPNNNEDNNALGGLYFNGSRIPNEECGASAIQPNGAPITDFVGVINLYQCGALPPAREGIYTCTMMNSAMRNQSVRLGIYIPGRSKYDMTFLSNKFCKFIQTSVNIFANNYYCWFRKRKPNRPMCMGVFL